MVEALREDRERAFEHIAAVEERQRQARKERDSLLRMADAGADVPKWRLDEAREAYFRAGDEAGRLGRRLYIEDIDPEHRKAIARQMAALLRDDSERRLRDIAARSDDPELRSAVAECKEEVARGTRYVVSRFRPPRDLPLHEIRRARREAGELLGYLMNPSVD